MSADSTMSNVSVVKNSLSIVVAQSLGIGSGIAFNVLTAAAFGATSQMDALFVALSVPQILVLVLTSNGIRTISPLLTEAFSSGGSKTSYEVLSGVMGWLLVALVITASLGIVGARLLVSILAPGLSLESKQVASLSLRILFLSIVPLGLVESFRALLVYQDHVFLVSLANFVRYGSGAIVLFLLKDKLGILSLGWAYVAGSVVQAVFYGICAKLTGGSYWPRLRKEDLFLLSSRIGPPAVGDLVGQSIIIVERFMASFLPPGTISALGFARRILAGLNTLLSTTVSTAILPRLLREVADTARLRQSIGFGIRLVALTVGLVVVLLLGLSRPLVSILFQRGVFDAEATAVTANMLALFAPSVLFTSILYLATTGLMALGRSFWVMYVRVAALLINVVAAVTLFKVAGGYALPLAYSVRQFAALSLALYFLLRLNLLPTRMRVFGIRMGVALSLVSILAYSITLYRSSSIRVFDLFVNFLTLTSAYMALVVLLGVVDASNRFMLRKQGIKEE